MSGSAAFWGHWDPDPDDPQPWHDADGSLTDPVGLRTLPAMSAFWVQWLTARGMQEAVPQHAMTAEYERRVGRHLDGGHAALVGALVAVKRNPTGVSYWTCVGQDDTVGCWRAVGEDRAWSLIRHVLWASELRRAPHAQAIASLPWDPEPFVRVFLWRLTSAPLVRSRVLEFLGMEWRA